MPTVKSNALLLRARKQAQEMNRIQKRGSEDAHDSAELDACASDYLKVAHQIVKAIQYVPDSRHRILLRARYLEAMTWPETAKWLGCCCLQAQRLHKEALRAFEAAAKAEMRDGQ